MTLEEFGACDLCESFSSQRVERREMIRKNKELKKEETRQQKRLFEVSR